MFFEDKIDDAKYCGHLYGLGTSFVVNGNSTSGSATNNNNNTTNGNGTQTVSLTDNGHTSDTASNA